MNYTANQAVELLMRRPDQFQTTDALRDLISKIDITGQGNVTYLYSGAITPNLRAENLAQSLALKGENIRIINMTEAALFLDLDSNTVFAEVLERVLGKNEKGSDPSVRGTPANRFLYDVMYDGRLGIWAMTSERFVKAAIDDIRVIAPFAAPNRVLGQVEIPTALLNSGVETIEGIEREHLLRLKEISQKEGRDPISVVTNTLAAVSEQSLRKLDLSPDQTMCYESKCGFPVLEDVAGFVDSRFGQGQEYKDWVSTLRIDDIPISSSKAFPSYKLVDDPYKRIEEAQYGLSKLKIIAGVHSVYPELGESSRVARQFSFLPLAPGKTDVLLNRQPINDVVLDHFERVKSLYGWGASVMEGQTPALIIDALSDLRVSLERAKPMSAGNELHLHSGTLSSIKDFFHKNTFERFQHGDVAASVSRIGSLLNEFSINDDPENKICKQVIRSSLG